MNHGRSRGLTPLILGATALLLWGCESSPSADRPDRPSCDTDGECLNGQRCDQNTNTCVDIAQGGAAGGGGEAGQGGAAGIAGQGGSAGAGGNAGAGGTAGSGGTAGAAGTGGSGGEPATDRDGDGVIDSLDNCDDIVNPEQTDTDGDGAGDACDAEPEVANYQISGQLLLVGGTSVDETHTMQGSGTQGAHQSRSDNYQLNGKLLP